MRPQTNSAASVTDLGSKVALILQNLLWFSLIAILVLLVVSPMASLLLSSLQTGDGSAWTIDNYLTAYGRVRYLDALLNSLNSAPLPRRSAPSLDCR